MYKIGKEFHFSAAHTIPGHPKCGRMHGHNYKVTIVLRGSELDEQGMLIDYGEVDRIVQSFIEAMDHKYLAAPDDKVIPRILGPHEVYHLDTIGSTAECIAKHLWELFFSVFSPARLEVIVCETDKTFASYSK